MKKTISMMSEMFENEKTGEQVEGITIIIDGPLKKILNIMKEKKPEYKDTTSLVYDALMKGLEILKEDIK